MKSPLCEAMDIPCQETRGSVTCEMCFKRYMVRELRKVKDEVKLLNVRLSDVKRPITYPPHEPKIFTEHTTAGKWAVDE